MRIVFGLALLGAACVVACGSSSSGGTTSKGGAASVAGESGTGGKNSGHGGASNGDAGDADPGVGGAIEPPVVSAAKPHAAGGLVAGGVVAHSAHFTGVFSLGAAPGGNGVSTSSTKTQLRGGVIGASQK